MISSKRFMDMGISVVERERVGRTLTELERAASELVIFADLGKVLGENSSITKEFTSRLVTSAIAEQRYRSATGISGIHIVTGHPRPETIQDALDACGSFLFRGRRIGRDGPRRHPTRPSEGEAGAVRLLDFYQRYLGEGQWRVLAIDEFLEEMKDNGSIPRYVIVKETRARNAYDNIHRIANEVVVPLRKYCACLRLMKPNQVPVKLCISVARYVIERMEHRVHCVPQMSEIQLARELIPGVELRFEEAPYPHLMSEDVLLRLRAEIYVTSHVQFDALLTSLYGRGSGMVERISREAFVRAREGVESLRKLFAQLEDVAGPEPVGFVEPLVNGGRAVLKDIKVMVYEAWDAQQRDGEPAGGWTPFAQRFGGLLNTKIRWAADTDRV